MADSIKKFNSFLIVAKRLLPIAILLVIVIGVFASGAHKALDFDRVALLYADLTGYISANPLVAILIALLIYTFATAISLPIAWLLSVSIGLIFGWEIGSVIVVFGATTGATLLFLSARYAFADFFKKRSKGFLEKMAKGFVSGATSYLLFLRLVPLFPFTLVNVVPAILGVRLFTFIWTTFVGIIPGVIAYTYAGEGLRSIVEVRALACEQNVAPCGQALSPSDLITKEILIAFFLLGFVSLIPVLLKKFSARNIEEENENS